MILVFGSRPPKDKPDMTQRYALDVRNVLDPVLTPRRPRCSWRVVPRGRTCGRVTSQAGPTG